MKKPIHIILAAGLLFGSMAANATVMLTISQTTDKDSTNPEDIQCVIYGNSCPPGQQEMASYDYAQSGGETQWTITADPNTAGTDATLPDEYTVGYLEGYVGRVFDIGIDVNTTGAKGEMLDYFFVYVNGTLEFAFDDDESAGGSPGGDYNIGSVFANGNGYFDWYLKTIDLTSFDENDVVTFVTHWYDASDGAENFFLVRNSRPPEIPEPGTLALLGASLMGLGFARRRKAA